MNLSPPAQARRSGFTLIELLVVIAILAILAGLLWPALARAKQKATQAGCMSNMKQISHALQMYLDDNTDVLPGPCFSGARSRCTSAPSSAPISPTADENPPAPQSVIAW